VPAIGADTDTAGGRKGRQTRLFRLGFPIKPRMSLREHTRAGLGRVEPCLPSPAKAPPSGPGWLHEIKHDGFRILARRDSAGVRLINRAGNDFSSRLRAARARAETARHST
jgi:ATP-dependent DNA ligase